MVHTEMVENHSLSPQSFPWWSNFSVQCPFLAVDLSFFDSSCISAYVCRCTYCGVGVVWQKCAQKTHLSSLMSGCTSKAWNTHMHTRTHARMHTCMHACTLARTHTHTLTYTHLNTHTP